MSTHEMKRNAAARHTAPSNGFTLIEVLVVVGVVGILGAVALGAYGNYVARARAAELALKFDAVRTNVAVAVKSGVVQEQCAALAANVNPANLQSPYAAMDVAFEPVAGGFTPLLRFCADAGSQGTRGVDVVRETHHLLSRTATIGQGAVIGEAVTSFTVQLADSGAICKVAPQVPSGGFAGCHVAKPTASGATPVTGTAATSSPSAATTVAAGTAPAVLPTSVTASAQSSCTPTQSQVARTVPREVMTFGASRTGFVMNSGDLQTGGDLRAFTFEVAVVGGPQVANQGIHGATIFSYASKANANEFLLWDPANVKISFNGLPDVATGVNINDGSNHRLTTTWDSASGTATLFDNGRLAWQGVLNRGGVLRGNGQLVLAQDQDSYGGGFAPEDAFQGKIVTAAFASAASTATQAASGPIQTYFTATTGLITQAVMDSQGQVIDATGRQTYTSGGALSKSTEMIDTKLFVTSTCN